MITTIFYILAGITLATALLTVISRNPIHSAIYMILCFFSIAGHYLMLGVEFLAIVHIIVYTGSVMVLMLFTLMLLNLSEKHEKHKATWSKLVAIISSCVMALVLFAAFLQSHEQKRISLDHSEEGFTSIKQLGQVLFNDYLVPFEFASILLLVAMIGVVMISKKENKPVALSSSTNSEEAQQD